MTLFRDLREVSLWFPGVVYIVLLKLDHVGKFQDLERNADADSAVLGGV